MDLTEINYQQVIEWLARDVLSSTDEEDHIEANVDRYLEDLNSEVQAKAKELFE